MRQARGLAENCTKKHSKTQSNISRRQPMLPPQPPDIHLLVVNPSPIHVLARTRSTRAGRKASSPLPFRLKRKGDLLHIGGLGAGGDRVWLLFRPKSHPLPRNVAAIPPVQRVQPRAGHHEGVHGPLVHETGARFGLLVFRTRGARHAGRAHRRKSGRF